MGGKGSRLFPFSSVLPKCLFYVAGKPCSRWIVERLINQGHQDIILCVNRDSEAEFRHEFRDLPNVKFSVSEEPLGTVGELLNAKGMMDETFGLTYGDDLTEIDYNALVEFHRSRHAVATIATTTMYRLPVGIVEVNDCGKVTSFSEKPYLGKLSWTGVAILEPEALIYFKVGEDVSLHTLPAMLGAGEKICAFKVEAPWYDVGDYSSWVRVNQHYRELLSS